MAPKSNTCFSKTTGNGLAEYYCVNDAEHAARIVNEKNGWHLEPYKCSRCGLWHLGHPATAPRVCTDCTSADRKPKHCYSTEEVAREYARRREEESGQLSLEVYECPHGSGYHLTKSGNRW